MIKRNLSDWVEGYMQFTYHSEPPDSFKHWTAVSVIAAALQRKVQISWGHITWYPNLYIVFVGPSASRKGTAMGPGLDLLTDLGVTLAAQATSRQALIRKLKDTTYTEIDPQTGEMDFHSSLTIFSKEFTVFLGYHNRELMSDLCDWYDCDKQWTYETIARSQEKIVGVWVNLIGATTPDLVAASLPADAIGSGLTSRIIFICEDSKGKVIPVHFLSKDELELRDLLYKDLEQINQLKGKFKFTEKFIDLWTDWYVREGSLDNRFNDPRFAGYTGRRATHVMKLSMVMSASRTNDLVITDSDLQRAINSLEWAERKMHRVFMGVGKSQIAETLPQVFAFIANKKETTFEEVLKTFYYDSDEQEMKRILRTLELSGGIEVKNGKIVYKSDIYHDQLFDKEEKAEGG